ncbi:MAG: thiamine phosphate synthase [Bacteroidales bacterium]|nr:thiamine phosphate synthase [Bacteroidales bacterium]
MKNFDPTLYLVTDQMLAKGRPVEFIVEQAAKGGATMVQLREKDCSTLDFVNLAILIKKLLDSYHIPLIINDRLDVALASDADGLHIGQEDMPYTIARKILGKNKIIGLSVENIEQAKVADEFDVDYIGLSPVFVTGTKPELTNSLGLEGVRRIASFSKHCMVAIGGIHAKNAAEVLKAGANGLAVVSAIVSADDPMKATREIRQEIDKFKTAGKSEPG